MRWPKRPERGMVMKKYNIAIMRSTFEERQFEVEASSLEEAKDKAHDEAVDEFWDNPHHADYEISWYETLDE